MDSNVFENGSTIKEELDLSDDSQHEGGIAEESEETISQNQKSINENQDDEDNDDESLSGRLRIDSEEDENTHENIGEYQELDANVVNDGDAVNQDEFNIETRTIEAEEETDSMDSEEMDAIKKAAAFVMNRKSGGESMDIDKNMIDTLQEITDSSSKSENKLVSIVAKNNEKDVTDTAQNTTYIIKVASDSQKSGNSLGRKSIRIIPMNQQRIQKIVKNLKENAESLPTTSQQAYGSSHTLQGNGKRVEESTSQNNIMEIIDVENEDEESSVNLDQETYRDVNEFIIDRLEAYKEEIVTEVCNKKDKNLLKRIEITCTNCKTNVYLENLKSDFCPDCCKVLMYKCMLCCQFWPKRLKAVSHVRLHYFTHCLEEKLKLEGTVECFHCKVRFQTLEKLMDHETVCEKALPFECSLCHRRMTTRDSMVEHIKNEHWGVKKNISVIKLDEKVTKTPVEVFLKRKPKNYTPSEEELTTCVEISKKLFAATWCKTCEERVETSQCPNCRQFPIYVCSLCGKLLNNKHQMDCHLRTMTHVRKFKYCGIPIEMIDGRAAIQNSSFVECRRCEKIFVSHKYLRKHMQDEICWSEKSAASVSNETAASDNVVEAISAEDMNVCEDNE